MLNGHRHHPSGAVVACARPLADAAARLRFHNAVSVTVVDENGAAIGTITERDIVRAVADGADTLTTPVSDYASIERVRS